jgi:PPK2 family polyphosphate:nucleotide phosphotransferase
VAKLVKQAREFARNFRVDDGKKFRLDEFAPDETLGLDHREGIKDMAAETLQEEIELLSEMQDKLYAQDRWGLLLIFQAMDAAGKDGTIKHVMSGINPQGCQVYSFKTPSSEDLDHDFLWRTSRCLPERGRIGIFNRSYYEEVLAVRVHPEFLEKQRLPARLLTNQIWKERFEDISAFERYATRNGIAIVKFFLNVSREEQKKRFLERLDNPDKNWKFSMADARERERWGDYMAAYEEMIRHTASPHAPWYVVPADKKWFTRLVVAAAILEALDDMNLAYPKVDDEKRKELEAARSMLEGKRPAGARRINVPKGKES